MLLAQQTYGNQEDPLIPSGAVSMKQGASASQVEGTNKQVSQLRPVSIELTEVMFTGRVPVSTWTFAFSIHSKLWISELTTLYFGKRIGMNKKIYQADLVVPDNRLDMEIGITAYNGYGDVLSASESIRVYSLNNLNNTSKLIRLDEDWTQLLFRFNIQVAS